MTKAENIFNSTRYAVLDTIDFFRDRPNSLSEGWVMGGWEYGKTPEGQRFMTQRTLNAVCKLIDREERRLDSCDKYGVEYDPANREAVRVLRDMAAREQRELDREKEERAARKTMSYDDFMAKYYPQYC